MTERLIVEKPENVATSWMNLPVLTVTLSQDDTDLFLAESQVNYLGVTVESIHNPPASFADSLAYRAATVVYKDGAVRCIFLLLLDRVLSKLSRNLAGSRDGFL